MEKFVAVVVNKGRKFRGEAYDIGSEVRVSTFNIYGHGRGGWRSCESVKLWSPTQGFVWCNPSYIEDREVAPEVEQADYAKFVERTFNDTMAFCRSRSTGKPEQEVIRFARCCIRKHHAEMLSLFDEKYGYKEDIATVVQSTLDWAFTLPYSDAKRVRLAVRALTKKGLAHNPDIVPAWTIWLDLRGLSRLVKKYLPEEVQAHCL
jgi:hypothetical protein